MNNEEQRVNLSELAELSGLPLELVKKELVLDGGDSDNVSLDQVREAMLKYLDSTMMSN